jgi:hypothetical protein
MFFVGDPGMPDAFSFNKVADFAPRAGIAWNPDGAGHQVLRAGFGLFYDSPMLFYYNDAGVDSPLGERDHDYQPSRRPDESLPGISRREPVPSAFAAEPQPAVHFRERLL